MKVLILGSAQDAGLPHIGCDCTHCSTARSKPELARKPPCIAIVDSHTQEAFVVDATPAIAEQLQQLTEAVGTRNCFHGASAMLITHAHMGHFPGLLFLGREAGHAKDLPVYTSAAMRELLETNIPFSHLSQRGEIKLQTVCDSETVPLNGRITVTPIEVPHRNEDADTHGFIFECAGKRCCYIPDIDIWTDDVVNRMQDCDVCIVDGSFFSESELPPGRMTNIRHPLIPESMKALGRLLPKTDIYFTHFNHSNPAVNDNGPEAQQVRDAGFKLANDGQWIDLTG